VESPSILRRRTASRRRTRWPTSILGAAALLAALGSASAFAADPTDQPKLDAREGPVFRIDERTAVLGDPREPIDDGGAIASPTVRPVLLVRPAATSWSRLERRADGSLWWCPRTGSFEMRMPCRLISPPSNVAPPDPTSSTGLETRADGSTWWCPRTGSFQMRMPCRLISSARAFHPRITAPGSGAGAAPVVVTARPIRPVIHAVPGFGEDAASSR
jgi:hypothetical protein